MGVVPGLNKPITTNRAEKGNCAYFLMQRRVCWLEEPAVEQYGSDCILVLKCGDKILIHKAPVYSTTRTSFEMLGLIQVEADFNDLSQLGEVLKDNPDIKGALVQYTRQKLDDSYDMEEVVRTIKRIRDIPILTDDNYAAMKVRYIGVQCGADLSCFSSFKLLGPEGIGIIVGKEKYIKTSGGRKLFWRNADPGA